MVADDRTLSESLCLALTKFSGIPQATHIQYTQVGLGWNTGLQRAKKYKQGYFLMTPLF